MWRIPWYESVPLDSKMRITTTSENLFKIKNRVLHLHTLSFDFSYRQHELDWILFIILCHNNLFLLPSVIDDPICGFLIFMANSVRIRTMPLLICPLPVLSTLFHTLLQWLNMSFYLQSIKCVIRISPIFYTHFFI